MMRVARPANHLLMIGAALRQTRCGSHSGVPDRGGQPAFFAAAGDRSFTAEIVLSAFME
jgi:hypothetical protein